MDIAELRNRLASIAAEIAEQEEVQQEDIAIEEEQVEEVEAPVAEEEFAEEDNLEVAEEEVAEEEVEETVEIPLAELDAIMKLAGFDGYKQVEEYANEPEEQYMDAEDQLIGLSGGLNGPKKMYPAAAGGDNPMDQEPREIEEGVQSIAEFENELYKSYKAFLEENEIKNAE